VRKGKAAWTYQHTSAGLYIVQAKHGVIAVDTDQLRRRNVNRLTTTAKAKSKSLAVMPPVNAEFLFHFLLDRQHSDAIIGDLEERYRKLHKKFGRRRANFWYWTQTVVSLRPIMRAWVKKVVMKPVVGIVTWAVAKGLVGHDSWLASVMELWKKVRS